MIKKWAWSLNHRRKDARARADPSAPWEPVFVFTRYRANWIYIVLAWNNTKTFNQLKLGTTILHKVTVGANYTETEQCGDGIRHSDASLKELSHSRLGRRLITGEQTHQHTTFRGSKGTGFSLSRHTARVWTTTFKWEAAPFYWSSLVGLAGFWKYQVQVK